MIIRHWFVNPTVQRRQRCHQRSRRCLRLRPDTTSWSGCSSNVSAKSWPKFRAGAQGHWPWRELRRRHPGGHRICPHPDEGGDAGEDQRGTLAPRRRDLRSLLRVWRGNRPASASCLAIRGPLQGLRGGPRDSPTARTNSGAPCVLQSWLRLPKLNKLPRKGSPDTSGLLNLCWKVICFNNLLC